MMFYVSEVPSQNLITKEFFVQDAHTCTFYQTESIHLQENQCFASPKKLKKTT